MVDQEQPDAEVGQPLPAEDPEQESKKVVDKRSSSATEESPLELAEQPQEPQEGDISPEMQELLDIGITDPFQQQVILGLNAIAMNTDEWLERIYWAAGGPDAEGRNKRHFNQDQALIARQQAEAQAQAQAAVRIPAGRQRGIPGGRRK